MPKGCERAQSQRLIQASYRAWVDRHDRRDLSLYRIARDTLQRCLTFQFALPVPTPSPVAEPCVR